MKTFKYIFLLPLFFSCKTYVKIQPSIKNDVEAYAQKIKYDIKSNDIAFLISYKEDTLNKAMLIPSHITIKLINDSLKTTLPKEDEGQFDFLFCKAEINNNALLINIASSDFTQQIQQLLAFPNISVIYTENDKYDKVYKRLISDKPQKTISMPVQVCSFIINDKSFAAGKTIYGKAILKSGVYYVKDVHFSSGYLKKRIYMEYLFKAAISN